MQIQKMPMLRRSASGMLFLLLIGALAGFINGLLGAGGGILLVYMLRHAAKRSREHRGTLTFPPEPRDIYANALSVTLPISVFSAIQYAAAGTLDLKAFSPMLLPSLLGGIAGGWLLDRLKLSFLRKLFALLVLISGILMIVRS